MLDVGELNCSGEISAACSAPGTCSRHQALPVGGPAAWAALPPASLASVLQGLWQRQFQHPRPVSLSRVWLSGPKKERVNCAKFPLSVSLSHAPHSHSLWLSLCLDPSASLSLSHIHSHT